MFNNFLNILFVIKSFSRDLPTGNLLMVYSILPREISLSEKTLGEGYQANCIYQ